MDEDRGGLQDIHPDTRIGSYAYHWYICIRRTSILLAEWLFHAKLTTDSPGN